MITTSEIKISVLVSQGQALAALRCVHATFELDKDPPPAQPAAATDNGATMLERDALDVVARLQGMEDLMIDDVTLDDSQARVTIARVPDTPGVAADVFEAVSAAGVFVDMIVQSAPVEGKANLSFTVPQLDLAASLESARAVSQRLGCGPVTHSPQVAKLSVSGIGMRSHSSVAVRMFESLARAGINVGMVSTSEVRVNVVVDGSQGSAALEALQQAFAEINQ